MTEPRGAAFFDMDHTLIAANSGRVYARALRRDGEMSTLQTLQVASWLLRNKLGIIDMTNLLERAIGQLRGTPERDVIERCDRLFDTEIWPHVYVEAIDRIEAHRAAGEPVLILSASTPYFVRELSQRLGLDGYLCTRPTVAHGAFTGQWEEPVCYGSGKVVWARRFCEEHGLSLEASAFYSDSVSDAPLLDAVGRPFAINPDPRLARLARKRNWPQHRYIATAVPNRQNERPSQSGERSHHP